MTPSNPDNQNPLIYRICDALGITHLVVAVQHSHLMSEITGLAAALAGKQNNLTFDTTPTANSTNPVTSGGVKAALDGKRDLIGQTISFVINGQEIEIESSDVPNLIRALSDPDSTPTANSNNLVTSGGVKAALDEATKAAFESSLPYYITTAHEKMKVYTRVLHNNSGSTMQLFECIDVSSLPAEERTNVWWNTDTSSIEIPNNTTFAIRFMRAANGVYCWFDGTFDY